MAQDEAEVVLPTFHWADYLVFVLSLAMSLAIGLYYAIIDRKKQSNEEFLMAGRSMSIGPVTASTFAALVSSIGFVADPVEVYYFGIGYFFLAIGGALSLIPIAELFVPAYHRMNLVSAFEFLEQRYNPLIGKVASLLQLLLMLLFMGMMNYASAVSLAQVSGISIALGMLITTAVCTVYTTFGGMKAVVWSSTIQMVLMFTGVIMLAAKAISDLGGWGPAFEIIRAGQRVNHFNWTANPFVRSSFWAYLVGGFFRVLVPLSSTQMAIQRYCTLPTIRQAKISVYLLIPMYLFLTSVLLVVGFAMYGHFAECDPMFNKQIEKVDQYVPFLVMEVLGKWHGMPGLFISAIFAASLSSISSGQNALAATILTDIIAPSIKKWKGIELSEKKSFFLAKGLAAAVGLLVFCTALLIMSLGGNLFMLFNKIFGVFAGPVGGLFTLAVLMKSITNVKCVVIGFLSAVAVTMWIAIGSEIYTFRPNVLPVSVAGCNPPDPFTNGTLAVITDTKPGSILDHLQHGTTAAPGSILDHISTQTTPKPPPPSPFSELEGFAMIYNLNPVYYSLLAYLVTILVTVIADVITKCCVKRRERSQSEKSLNGAKYSAVIPPETASWEKEKAKRLSKMPPYIMTRKDVSSQTLESIPPGAHRDVLWVYDKESNL